MTKKQRKKLENQISSVKKSLRASEKRFFRRTEKPWVHPRYQFKSCWIEPVFYDEEGRRYKKEFGGMRWYRVYE